MERERKERIEERSMAIYLGSAMSNAEASAAAHAEEIDRMESDLARLRRVVDLAQRHGIAEMAAEWADERGDTPEVEGVRSFRAALAALGEEA